LQFFISEYSSPSDNFDSVRAVEEGGQFICIAKCGYLNVIFGICPQKRVSIELALALGSKQAVYYASSDSSV